MTSGVRFRGKVSLLLWKLPKNKKKKKKTIIVIVQDS